MPRATSPVKTAVFWLCVISVVGAIAWTLMNVNRRSADGTRGVADRILRERGLSRIEINQTPGVGDVYCPQGTGSSLFSAVDRAAKPVRGVVCTARGQGFVLTLE